jgi:hypothetical protein
MGKGKNDEEQVDISQGMKSKVQPSQDNRDPMVKKLEKGATVTCYKCHGEGHKFYKGNISGGNQPLHANYGNFNLSHTMLIQRGVQRRWEE